MGCRLLSHATRRKCLCRDAAAQPSMGPRPVLLPFTAIASSQYRRGTIHLGAASILVMPLGLMAVAVVALVVWHSWRKKRTRLTLGRILPPPAKPIASTDVELNVVPRAATLPAEMLRRCGGWLDGGSTHGRSPVNERVGA